LSLISVLVLPRTVIRFRRPSGFQPTVIVPVQRSSRDGPCRVSAVTYMN
jgi:hypothetical protein